MKKTMIDLVPSYLLQRLKRRPKDPEWINPFNFGGGLRMGGLTEEVTVALQSAFQFDYMGAEFGKVPSALQTIHDNQKEYHHQSLNVYSIQYPLGDEEWWTARGWIKPEGPVEFYLIIPSGEKSREIKKRLVEYLQTGKETDDFRPRDSFDLARAVFTPPADQEHYARTVGWFERDNAFFVFIDRDAFEMTLKIFPDIKAG